MHKRCHVNEPGLFVVAGLVALLLLCLTAARAADAGMAVPAGAQEFWSKFRAEALTGDGEKVAGNTRFPFEIKGTLDDGKKKTIDRPVFVKTFPLLLKADPGVAPEPTAMKDFVQATPQLRASFCSPRGDQFRVGNWVFAHVGRDWKFVRAYKDD